MDLKYIMTIFLLMACGCSQNQDLYEGLNENEDGVINFAVTDEWIKKPVEELSSGEAIDDSPVQADEVGVPPKLGEKPSVNRQSLESIAPLPGVKSSTINNKNREELSLERERSVNPHEGETVKTALQGEIEEISIDSLMSKAAEMELIRKKFYNRQKSVSYIVVKEKTGEAVKAHNEKEIKILASVTKITTAIATLENAEVNIGKMRSMLKRSHNGESSRYLHLAAKAIASVTIKQKPYSVAHSCPRRVLYEKPLSKVILNWLRDEYDQIDFVGAGLSDGAGCTHGNKMSAFQLSELLLEISKSQKEYDGYTFEELLSVSGKDGTWRGRNKDNKGQILAKTGTLSAATNLAGYFYSASGEKYIFALLIKKSRKSETRRARSLTEDLLRLWLREIP